MSAPPRCLLLARAALLGCALLLLASPARADDVGLYAKLDAGPIYIDESYDYYGARVTTFGAGVGASALLGFSLGPQLALGVGAEAAIAVQPFTLVEGYISSIKEHDFGFGVAGPFLDARPIEDVGLRLHALLGVAYSSTDTPTTNVGDGLGVGGGLGLGYDFAIDAPLSLETMLRATASQTWDTGTDVAITAYSVGLFLALRYDGSAG